MNTTIIHPMLVHFPIALLLTGFALLLYWLLRRNKPYAMKLPFVLSALGSVSLAAALIAGFVFTSPMVGIMGRIRTEHLTFASATLVVSVVASVLLGVYTYRKNPKCGLLVAASVLYGLAAALVAYTGHLGGQMVFGL